MRCFKQWVFYWLFDLKNATQCNDNNVFRTWKQTLPTYLIKIRHACKPRVAPLRPALAIMALTRPFQWLNKASPAVKAESFLMLLVCLEKRAKLFTWNRTCTTCLKLIVVERSHFSGMFWINCIYCLQLTIVTIMDHRATRPFLFLNQFFSSPELKAQVSYSDRPLSVCKLLHFQLLQNHWANFNQTWHKSSFGGGDSSLFKWRGSPISKGR
jgi:hypothetical protein